MSTKFDRERALADAYYEDGGERGVHGHEYVDSAAEWQHRRRDEGMPVSVRIGVYPGSFNPPTRAHLEIALAARDTHGLSRVDLAVSAVALGKETVRFPDVASRIEVIRASIADIDGLGLIVTRAQLITEIADGYDVVVMGADKWSQVNDPVWYGDDEAERDAHLARLPDLALAPRPPHEIPAEHRLPVAEDLLEISSTAAREGRREWMTDAARASGLW